MSTSTSLDTIKPEITMRNGANVKIASRNVRRFNGQLCVSVRGKLVAITVTGPRTAQADLNAPALHDFGSQKAAAGKVEGVPSAQEIAPVITLASIGVDRPAKGEARVSKASEITELREQVTAMSQMLAAYMTHKP